ncbi:putative disease resistance protein RGA3 [Olea europaea var. sylvestris]|uniref:putative disease resistance protein RGA3 n=1 Tax=Olea europaea var. sylvestris TaxID=158386 RepID=UPI000C1D87B6|nr:putative disease resistance protein RGA3 [Olea europaea var. sylvestris]
MASIVVPPFLQVIIDKLSEPVFRRIDDIWHAKDRLNKLQRILPRVQGVIEDAEERQITDKAVRTWLSQLKDAASKVEDLLEEFRFNCMHEGLTKNLIVILQDLEKAAEEGLSLHLKERNIANKQFEKKETSSFVIGPEVYGREEDKRKIVDMLLVGGGTTSVISIVGPPGIGKTTLAQFIYNDDEVKKHFGDLRIWVFVSQDFNAKRIIKEVIEKSTGKKCDLMDLDGLHSQMLKSLKEKKYLLVLDDVWNEAHGDWEQLMPLFKCGVDGSKILVTTRSQKAALVIGNRDTAYRLKGLSNDDCWKIFTERAFFTRTEEEEYLKLQAIGKELMRKCGGVPLAAKILGGRMRLKRKEEEWLYVQNSNLWNLRDYKDEIFPVLLVSYMHLPPHLKHCFAFCSIFPKNYEIKREKLIPMWIALGLILPDGGSKALEEIGDEYFNELVWMSVFEDVMEYEGGVIRRYKINEHFHSLAQSLTENECLVSENRRAGNSLDQVRHASIVSKHISSPILNDLLRVKHLRTLLVFSEGGALEDCSHIIKHFPYLRMLDLSGCLVQLPSMNYLPLLKHLDLSNNHFYDLPSEISSLCSLLTLNLFGCYNLRSLPNLTGITGLKHLIVSGCEALQEMPVGIGSLSKLQTLPIYVVGHRCNACLYQPHPSYLGDGSVDSFSVTGVLEFFAAESYSCSCPAPISDLEPLKLRGELKIKHLERVHRVEEVESKPLMNNEYLESLGLCWGNEAVDRIMNPALEANIARPQERNNQAPGPSEEPETRASYTDTDLPGKVLVCLQPHKNLKKIFIVGYPGIEFPCWTLPNLTEMVLINCRGCEQLPIHGMSAGRRAVLEEETRPDLLGLWWLDLLGL